MCNSCGLPTYSVLIAPELVYTRDNPDDISQENNLVFTNAYDNQSSIFYGYELYYKIYDPLDAANSETEYLTDETTIDNYSTADESSLENLGFERLYFDYSYISNSISHSETKPSFALDDDILEEDFNIVLNFNQDLSPGSTFLAESDGSVSFSSDMETYIYRHVENSDTGEYNNKFFFTDNFSIYDSDMPESIDIDSYTSSTNEDGGYYLYITFYILSFGKEQDDVSKLIYSKPVYLGTLKFNCQLTTE
ncbi:MAG: hypothetical protein PQJ61_03790 [Spirochaetales bacterium]|uniref:Uncharacterized protein n=1 Tax=Candidatus Thalassospirochaeta sargassi TaxID=3119039 RepID=A0AAJ1IAR2_9SPIO|nr:hypothetical protein [Spirochaetales bacterium]